MVPTKQLASVRLYFDPEAFEAESGEPLNNAMLYWLGKLLEEQACSMYGYEGVQSGWYSCPA